MKAAILRISDRYCVLQRPDADTTHIEFATGGAAESIDVLAKDIAPLLEQLDGCKQPVILVIPAQWCYVHTLNVPQRRPNRAALRFALEEFIPDDIERYECDFVALGSGNYLGVALARHKLIALLDALRSGAVVIDAVTVAAPLPNADNSNFAAELWWDAEHVAWVEPANGSAASLHILRGNRGPSEFDSNPNDCDAMNEDLEGQSALALMKSDVTEDNAEVLNLSQPAAPLEIDWARQAARLDLLRDRLGIEFNAARSPAQVDRILLAVLIGMLVVWCGMYLRTQQLKAQDLQINTWERALFQEVFPDEPIPRAVALRIRAASKAAAAARQHTTQQQEQGDTLALLVATLAALPEEVRFTLSEIRAEGNGVALRGTTRDHRDAERLARAINQNNYLHCDNPRADRRDKDVQFYLRATPVPKDQQK